MDYEKRLILAVAGSGKTYHLVQQLNEHKRFLLLTYTISGTQNIKEEIIKRFGFWPNNITVLNFFSFLYSFCYKPYLNDEVNAKGISWTARPGIYNKSYTTGSGYLYHNRISKLVLESVREDILRRLERYFQHILIDEIQDFAGNDFNFIMYLLKGNLNILLVGDFYQHTFDTSRDGTTNNFLHNDFNKYVKRFENAGVDIDKTTLIKSRRCSKPICDFITSKLGITIESLHNSASECRLVTEEYEAKNIFKDNNIVKLFLQKHYDYNCRSDNWGACKGLTFGDVCIIINNEIMKMINNSTPFNFKSATTKSKFYVACSRASGNLYFVHDKLIRSIL